MGSFKILWDRLGSLGFRFTCLGFVKDLLDRLEIFAIFCNRKFRSFRIFFVLWDRLGCFGDRLRSFGIVRDLLTSFGIV